MLIEELIRLGRPLLNGDLKSNEVLRLITDVADDRIKNFYRNVFVVVLPGEGSEPVSLARQTFGEPNVEKKNDLKVDADKALGVPLTLPSGGNPLNPQGRYGLPVYLLYDPHMQAFRESAQSVEKFLEGRLERTENFTLDTATRQLVAQAIHSRVATTVLDPKKNLGVLVLAQCDRDGFYQLTTKMPTNRIGDWNNQAIVPNYDRILAAIWEAKIQEGREAGMRQGPCSIDNTGDESVSAYCKAWPWAFPTWTCPLPDGGNTSKLAEGIALSPISYRALVVGACVFNQLTQRVSRIVIPEIFSPADTRPGREQAQRRSVSDLPNIVGSGFLLPLQEDTLNDPDNRFEFVRGVRKMLAHDPQGATQADRYLASVLGFEAFLPKEFDNDDYRLTLVYFSGDYTRGDVKLRAVIQDVVPSKLSRLHDLAKVEAVASTTLLRQLLQKTSEKQQNWYRTRYDSVPWLLARAYGGAYLWSQLEALLHGRNLKPTRITTNLARRLESLIPTWPKSNFAVSEEVVFYLNVLRFLGRVNREVAGLSEEYPMPMQNWKEMLRAVENGPVENLLDGEPSAAELGFACGAIIRRFSRRYYVGMRKTKLDADFLRDRVLTFGSALRWDAVQHRALKFINELPNNQLKKQIKYSRDLAERAAAVSDALRRNAVTVERNKDEFLTAFWCGYALQGYEKPRITQNKKTTPQLQERQ